VIATLDPVSKVDRVIDARGSYCPGPLMELIRAIRESEVGTVISVRSSDSGSRIDIPKWIEKAGHRLIGISPAEGFDEIVVQKLH
jgi:TusA-related sulfurtransferase